MRTLRKFAKRLDVRLMTFSDNDSFACDYYVARVLFGFSEEEFWRSTPRTLRALQVLHLIYRNKARFRESKQEISLKNRRALEELGLILGLHGVN